MGTEVYELADSLLAELLESEGHHVVLERYRANHPWDADSVSLVLALIEDLHSSGRLRYAEYQSLRNEIATWSPVGVDESTDQFPDLAGIDVEDPTEELENGDDATAILPLTPDGIVALRAAVVAPAADEPPPPPEPPAAPLLEPGTTLDDRYVLERPIGGGGYSIVFKARDLNREALGGGTAAVAIKVLRPQWNRDPRAIARLKQEFAIASQLAHPGVVRVHDVGCDRGQWFLALEYLEGESLDLRLHDRERGALTREQSLAIATACAAVLDFAHARGFVHGDLKPGNIFLAARGDVRLLDWAGGASGAETSAAEGRAATPAYASPQVLDGSQPVAADDIFSLAVIASELLAHRHPFDRGASSAWRKADRRPDLGDVQPAHAALALAEGLAWLREERPASAGELVARMIGPPQAPAPEPPAPTDEPLSASISEPAPPTAPAPMPAPPIAVESYDPTPAVQPVSVPAPKRRPVRAIAADLLLRVRTAPTGFKVAALALALLLALVLLRPAAQAPQPPAAAVSPAVEQPAAQDLPAISFAEPPHAASNALPLGPLTEGIEAREVVPDPQVLPSASPDTTSEPVAEPQARAAAAPTPVRGPWVSFESPDVTTSEAAVTAVLRIQRLEQLSGRTRIAWRTISGTATAGEDFESVTNGVAEFAVGQSVRAIYVPLVPDDLAEGDETFVVEISSPRRNVRIGPIAQATVTIRDDD